MATQAPRSPYLAPLAEARDVARGADLPVLGNFGPYEILGRLAIGGMAEILLARRRGSEPLVIKKILAQYARDDDFVEMFLDEARIGLALDHPNIGRFLDFGEIDRQLFIAMEWVHGVTLGRFIRRARDAGGLPFPVACEIVARVADALHYAHTARDADGNVMGLIHRDVSPHNVMIDFDGTVKLLDFGIAKAVTQGHHTQVGVVKGKFAYMAPEQCRGNTLDFRIDIFALGVVLFEALTGRRLYRRESQAATMQAIIDEAVPSLVERLPTAPRELEAILRTALQKDPNARFPTAAAMRDVLQQYVARSSQDVGPACIAGLVQQFFRDELESPLVDSTPFGYDLGSGHAEDLESDEVPSSSGHRDVRAMLGSPKPAARPAHAQEPAAKDAPAKRTSQPSDLDAGVGVIPSVTLVPDASPPSAPTPSPSRAAPSPRPAPSQSPPRLSIADLFDDAVVNPSAPTSGVAMGHPAKGLPPAEPPPPAPAEDPLDLFADLPVPEVEVEVPARAPTPQLPRTARTPEPPRASERRRERPPVRGMPIRDEAPAEPGHPVEPAPLGVTPGTPPGSEPVAEECAPSHRVWKVLTAMLLVALVVLGGLAFSIATSPTTTSLTVSTEPPGAPIRLNGASPVASPATFNELTRGLQRVVVDGRSGPRWEGSIYVEAGTARTLRIVLE